MVQTLKMDLWAFALEFSASGKPSFVFASMEDDCCLALKSFCAAFQSPATTMRAAMVYSMSFAATLWHVRISGLGNCYSWQTCFRISMGWLHVLNIDVWPPNDPNGFMDMGLFRNGAPKSRGLPSTFLFLWDKAIFRIFLVHMTHIHPWSMKYEVALYPLR